MRIDYRKHFPAGAEAMAGLERAVRSSALEPALPPFFTPPSGPRWPGARR